MVDGVASDCVDKVDDPLGLAGGKVLGDLLRGESLPREDGKLG